MNKEYEILIILFIHWVADFILQTDKMALNKSKSNRWLLTHTLVYSLVWFAVGICIFDFYNVLIFTLITFITHTLTDYVTSRITRRLYNVSKHYFFVVIGFDQFLHYTQLLLTYYFTTS